MVEFEEYIVWVKQRNRETHTDGHLIVFNFTDEKIDGDLDYFRDCWEGGLSAYKALTFWGLE